ncbi:6-aminohexanoate hydrolase, partial [Enterococcus faecalis]|nr:6-aminohexanoate hydrolase [Enterococcus faecalis]
DRTLLQLGALFENNHKINQPHVEEPDKDKEPDASGEPEKGKDSDASGKPDKDKETKTSEGPIEGKDQNQNPDKAGKTTSESS